MTIVMGENAFRPASIRGPGGTVADAGASPRLAGAPVLCICGYSGAGKTTLIEAVLHEIRRRGLAVAVIKHDAHGFTVDRPGKDSDRFFKAGATVALRNAQEQFQRRGHPQLLGLDAVIADFARDHDLILVEGHKATPLPKLWLASEGETRVPEDISRVEGFLGRDQGRLAACLGFLDVWLPQAWRRRPVGWLRMADDATDGYFVIGGDDVWPRDVMTPRRACRLPIAPDLTGPTAALVTAHRWAPQTAWMMLPAAGGDEASAWLMTQRRPGIWTIRPRRPGGSTATIALYEPQALTLLERDPARHVAGDDVQPDDPRALHPTMPQALVAALTAA